MPTLYQCVKLGTAVNACNPSILRHMKQEKLDEGQPGLQRETFNIPPKEGKQQMWSVYTSAW